jgi:hypothetical protein
VATIERAITTAGLEADSLSGQLVRLVRLELELGAAELRGLLVSAGIAIAVGVVSAIAGVAAVALLLAGALAPLFGGTWAHLVIAGGVVFTAGLAGIGWSVWRLRSLDWPRETLASLAENWQWLVAQVRSRLTLR